MLLVGVAHQTWPCRGQWELLLTPPSLLLRAETLFVVRSAETIEILPLFYLPEMDLLQWLREAVLSAHPRVHPGLHRRSEEPLISPCQSYGGSKISQHATRVRRGDSRSWLTSGVSGKPSVWPLLGKTKKKSVLVCV